MTRHALAEHAPDGAIFAVSSFGHDASGNRPPAELRPLGLEGPLGWVAEQLEARDRADMNSLWETGARATCPGWSDASPPTSGVTLGQTGRTSSADGSKSWRGSGAVRWVMRGVAAALLAAGMLAGSDLLAFYRASSFERAGDSAAARGRSQLVRAARTAPFAADVLAGPGQASPTEKRRVASQGGRRPGRQRYGRRPT